MVPIEKILDEMRSLGWRDDETVAAIVQVAGAAPLIAGGA